MKRSSVQVKIYTIILVRKAFTVQIVSRYEDRYTIKFPDGSYKENAKSSRLVTLIELTGRKAILGVWVASWHAVAAKFLQQLIRYLQKMETMIMILIRSREEMIVSQFNDAHHGGTHLMLSKTFAAVSHGLLENMTQIMKIMAWIIIGDMLWTFCLASDLHNSFRDDPMALSWTSRFFCIK